MKPLIITMGEPCSIAMECTIKAWRQTCKRADFSFALLHDPQAVEYLLTQLNETIPMEIISSPQQACKCFSKALPIIPFHLPHQPVLGKIQPENTARIMENISQAYDYVHHGQASALVTNPIEKKSLYHQNFNFPGHTEYLAHLDRSPVKPVMMLSCENLNTIPLTIHVPLAEVSSLLTQELIIETAQTAHDQLKEKFNFQNPRMALAALNPHAGEQGAIGDEEQKIMIPAVNILKKRHIDITLPLPSDSLFHAHAREKYDVIVCPYHDQALIPIKTLDFYSGVNTTLGLSIIRTSPDHGTALSLPPGQANPTSLIQAMKMAEKLVKNKVKAQ